MHLLRQVKQYTKQVIIICYFFGKNCRNNALTLNAHLNELAPLERKHSSRNSETKMYNKARRKQSYAAKIIWKRRLITVVEKFLDIEILQSAHHT